MIDPHLLCPGPKPPSSGPHSLGIFLQKQRINRFAPQIRAIHLFQLSMALFDRHIERKTHLVFLSLSESTRRPTEALGKIATVSRCPVHRSTRAQGLVGLRAYDTPRQPLKHTFQFGHLSRTPRGARLVSPRGPPLATVFLSGFPTGIPRARPLRPPEPRGNMLIINRVVFSVEETGMGSGGDATTPPRM